jgi:hypothetical protein
MDAAQDVCKASVDSLPLLGVALRAFCASAYRAAVKLPVRITDYHSETVVAVALARAGG